jgi:hypothetical protein
MYPKGMAGTYRTEFFNFLKLKMKRHKSADGSWIAWLKYPTGIEDLYFRCEFEQDGARFCIDYQHRDAEIRQMVFDQFLQMKPVLEEHLGKRLKWEAEFQKDGMTISRIYVKCPATNLFEKDTWPSAFAFFEKKLRSTDEFWSMARYTFMQLLY